MTTHRVLAATFALSLVAVAGCGSDDEGGSDTTPATSEAPATTAAPPTTGSPETTAAPTTGAPSELTIESFSADDPESCDGGEAIAQATWSTEGADGVTFSVDGEPVPADAGQPTSGSGGIPVPCDGASHEITLEATGSDGNSASQSVTVQSPSS